MTAALLQPFAWGLLHLLWQGLVVMGVALAAFALIPARHAALRHRVAFAALMVLLALPVATTAIMVLPGPSGASGTGWMDASTARSETAVLVRHAVVRTSLLAEWIVAGWAAGALLLGVRLGGGLWWSRRLRRREVSATPRHWREWAREVAERLDLPRVPDVLVSPHVSVPTLAGHARPAVLIPPALATGLTADEARAVLAHELAHLARGDHWRNLLLAVTRVTLFFHPAVHWLARRLEIERERAADDVVLSLGADRLGYARTLARLEEFRRPRFGAPELAIPASGGNLRARILRVARGDERDRLGLVRAVAAGMPTMLILLAGTMGALPASQVALSGRMMEIAATDPAGKFSLSVLDGRVIAARVNGRALVPGEWRQQGNQVIVSDRANQPLVVTLRPDGISWSPRQPSPNPIPE